MKKLALSLLCLACYALACGVSTPPTPGPEEVGHVSEACVSCSTDSDCVDAGLPTETFGYLCYQGQCKIACNSPVNSNCPRRKKCVFIYEDSGQCYRHPGCNPPPPGIFCPSQCYGICE
jgi:hypothetical protein